MLRRSIIGLCLLVGGLLIGGVGWSTADNEVIGCAFGFVGLMTVLSGGMLLQSGRS